MVDFKIILINDIFVSKTSDKINTIFYISCDGRNFPDDQWMDVPQIVLEMWKTGLHKRENQENVWFEMPFFEGPYKMNYFKDDKMQLKIDCVSGRGKEDVIEFSFEYSYYDFMRRLYEAFQALKEIMELNKLEEGIFESAYRQTSFSVAELKAMIEKWDAEKE